jgi:TRAP-type C4-dicarboxylate transport system substrate-binding protein
MKQVMAAMVALAIGSAVATARADEATLIFGTGQNPDTVVVKEIYGPWVAAVNAAGKGIVQIDERDGRVVLNTTNFYDQASNDVVQIAFGSMDYLTGKFELSSVAVLPTEANSEVASVAFWRLYKSGLLDSDFDDTVPLFVLVYPPTLMHVRKPVTGADNLKGLKIAPTSKLIAHELQLLGANPVSMTYQETFSALQRGTIDGLTFPIAGIYSQNFGSLVPVHVNVPLGGGISMIFMMKKKFNALSPQAQKILANASGEAMAAKDGALYDRLTNEAVTTFRADPKQSFIELSPATRTKWEQDTAAIDADWIKQSPGRDKVFAKFRELLAEVRAGK